MMSIDIDYLRTWIGRIETHTDVLSLTQARQFNATFDLESGTELGDDAPVLIHFCLAQPMAPSSLLGNDGHPELGGFLPPVPLPRRMWAGGAIRFHGRIRVGDTVERKSEIVDVSLKTGRSGALCFVTVRHEIFSDGHLAVSERQDIVYRDIPSGKTAKPTSAPAPIGEQHLVVTPSPTFLFRYSALTFNGHRIHYDKPFCVEHEGYPDLVVHGPLQATLLCQYATDLKQSPPKEFEFRSLSPIFANGDFTLNAETTETDLRLWTAGVGAPTAMEARAKW